jgi:hypothetical protein
MLMLKKIVGDTKMYSRLSCYFPVLVTSNKLRKAEEWHDHFPSCTPIWHFDMKMNNYKYSNSFTFGRIVSSKTCRYESHGFAVK